MASNMPWKLAVDMAALSEDVTYEEWCSLYVAPYDPTPEQIEIASRTAYEVLVRNGVIEAGVVFETTPRRN